MTECRLAQLPQLSVMGGEGEGDSEVPGMSIFNELGWADAGTLFQKGAELTLSVSPPVDQIS